jgi:superfamily I DNA and/or RNA helicase
LTNHQGCQQQSDQEVALTAELASRLIRDHGISASRIALISPHRAQNNATADRLARLLGVDSHADLPLIDTVERVQGAERDIIIYACTVSDLDRVASPFINQPHRFNVAITRARQKLIVLGSRRFFGTIPVAEEALGNNRCFKEFYEFCWGRGCLVEVPGKLKESL